MKYKAFLFCLALVGESRAQNDEVIQSVILDALYRVDEMKEKLESQNPESIFELFEPQATIYNDIILDSTFGRTIDVQSYLEKIQVNGFKLNGVDAESYLNSKYFPIEVNSFIKLEAQGSFSIVYKKIISGVYLGPLICKGKVLKKLQLNSNDTIDLIINFNYYLNPNESNHQRVALIKIASIDGVKSGHHFILFDSPKNKTLRYSPKDTIRNKYYNQVSIISRNSRIQKFYTLENNYNSVVFDESIGIIRSRSNFLLGKEKIIRSNSKPKCTFWDMSVTRLKFRAPQYFMELSINSGVLNFSGSHIISNKSTSYKLTNNQSSLIGMSLAKSLKKLKQVDLYLAAGYSFNDLNYSLNLDSISYYSNELDPDGESYKRITSVYNIREEASVQLHKIPVDIQGFVYSKGYKYFIHFNLGLEFELLAKGNRVSLADANFSGYYRNLFGITFSENGVYDFGNFEIQKSAQIELNRTEAIFGGLGIGYKLNRINFLGKISYHRDIRSLFLSTSNVISSGPQELNSITTLFENNILNQYFLGLSMQYHF